MQERYPTLFSPVKIGSVTLKNRVVRHGRDEFSEL